jgi:hypothetical protein
MADAITSKKKPLRITEPSSAANRSTLELPGRYAAVGELPRLTSGADLEAHDMHEVHLIGMYVPFDARVRQEPPARHDGHVGIRLLDGTLVTLFPSWHRHARRPVAEIAQFEGKQVEIVGTLFTRAPACPDGGASLMAACIDDIRGLWIG